MIRCSYVCYSILTSDPGYMPHNLMCKEAIYN